MTTATTLNGGINAVVTSLTVRDVLGFPSSGTYDITIDSEQMTVTAGQGTTTWTVTRGVNSTTAAIHADAAAVYLYEDAYATVDDLLLTMRQTVTDTAWLARARQALIEASRDLDREIGWSELRTTGTKLYDAKGGSSLIVPEGIASLTSIDIRLSTGAVWTALQAEGTGWILDRTVRGYSHRIRLLETATYTEFPEVIEGIRLTGTFGDPDSRKAACIAWARQRIALDPSMPGGVTSGPEDLGGAASLDRWPRVVYDLVTAERHLYWDYV